MSESEKTIKSMPPLEKEILALLKERAKQNSEYINPNFLIALVELLEAYYQPPDEELDEIYDWIRNMFSM